MLKGLTRKLLYASGALGLYHRLRNAGSLTVVVFHRTLSIDDPRWASCDPDYTFAIDVFVRSLQFFKKHYNVVSLAQLLDARRTGRGLPPCALLVTFDDGWADNVEHALPALQQAGLPALMFVVADAIGRWQPFYQEQIIAAWRRGILRIEELATAISEATASPITQGDDLPTLRRLIEQLQRMPRARREALLAPFATAMDDGLRHMVDADELQRLRRGGVALGLHGKTHAPLTEAEDLDAELIAARRALASSLAAGTGDATAESMSFPHGAYDAVIAERAKAAGYELVFTTVPVLNPVGDRIGWLLGRSGFEASTVVDARSRFRPDWLAWYLFRRESRRLA